MSTGEVIHPKPPVTQVELARDAVGFGEVLFQALATIGPAYGAAFGIPFGAAYAGGSLPLSVMIAAALCLTTAISVGELARHLPSAGGAYTFVSRGIGPRAGFFVAWSFVSCVMLPITPLLLGVYVAGLCAPAGSTAYLAIWMGTCILLALVVTVIGYLGVRVSTHAGTALGIFEMVVFLALALWIIAHAGSANTLRPFGLGLATVKDHLGASGIMVGVLYSISAMTGFDSATPLAEETRDPRRTIRRATVASCIVGGLFYVFTTYAAAIGYGEDRFESFARFDNGTPWIALARTAWGGGWVLVFLAIFNSIVANQNAWSNVFSRTLYALARIRLLPAELERTHVRWRSPHVAVVAYGAINVVTALGLGIALGPADAITLLVTLGGSIAVMIYVMLNIACFSFYLRERREELSLVRHVAAPLAGVLVFVPMLLMSLGIGSTRFSFIQPLIGIARFAGPILGTWLVVGVALYVWLARRYPDRLRATGQIFLDAPEPDPHGSPRRVDG